MRLRDNKIFLIGWAIICYYQLYEYIYIILLIAHVQFDPSLIHIPLYSLSVQFFAGFDEISLEDLHYLVCILEAKKCQKIRKKRHIWRIFSSPQFLVIFLIKFEKCLPTLLFYAFLGKNDGKKS